MYLCIFFTSYEECFKVLRVQYAAVRGKLGHTKNISNPYFTLNISVNFLRPSVFESFIVGLFAFVSV